MLSPNQGYFVLPITWVLFPFRVIQLIIGLAVLGISAYHLSLFVPYGITYDVSFPLTPKQLMSDVTFRQAVLEYSQALQH
jgi:hypothetical protein